MNSVIFIPAFLLENFPDGKKVIRYGIIHLQKQKTAEEFQFFAHAHVLVCDLSLANPLYVYVARIF